MLYLANDFTHSIYRENSFIDLPGPAVQIIIEYLDLNTLYTIAALKKGRPLRSIITNRIKNVLANRLKEQLSTRSPNLYDKFELVGSVSNEKIGRAHV